MHARLAPLLAGLSEAEARVIWEAIGQYVDNVRDAINDDDDADPLEINLTIAESLLEKMDSAIAMLAA